MNTGDPAIYTTEMRDYQITGNTVGNELLGIGVVGMGSDPSFFKSFPVAKTLDMNNYWIIRQHDSE